MTLSSRQVSGAKILQEHLVEVQDPADIETVEQVRAQICDALRGEGDVVVDVSSVTEVDLAFLQLIEAARIEAGRRGAALRLKTAPGEAIRTALQRAGLLSTPQQAAFWLLGPSFWLQGAEVAP
jgi:anti-anti-sigma regulatory factor